MANTKAFIENAEREAQLVDALLLVRHTLVVHEHMMCSAEGETWELDFRPEIARIDAALNRAGIDTTGVMHCPKLAPDDDEDGDDD